MNEEVQIVYAGNILQLILFAFEFFEFDKCINVIKEHFYLKTSFKKEFFQFRYFLITRFSFLVSNGVLEPD